MELRFWCALTALSFCLVSHTSGSAIGRTGFTPQRRAYRRTFSSEEGDENFDPVRTNSAADEPKPPRSYSQRSSSARQRGNIQPIRSRTRPPAEEAATPAPVSRSSRRGRIIEEPTSYAEVKNTRVTNVKPTRSETRGRKFKSRDEGESSRVEISSSSVRPDDNATSRRPVRTRPQRTRAPSPTILTSTTTSTTTTSTTTTTTTNSPAEVTSPFIDESKIEIINSNLDDLTKINYQNQISSTTEKQQTVTRTPRGRGRRPVVPGNAVSSTESSKQSARRGRINSRVQPTLETQPLYESSSIEIIHDSSSSFNAITPRPHKKKKVFRGSRLPLLKQELNETETNTINNDSKPVTKDVNEKESSSTTSTLAPKITRRPLKLLANRQKTEENKIEGTTKRSITQSARGNARGIAAFQPSPSLKKPGKTSDEVGVEDNYPESFKALLQAKSVVMPSKSLEKSKHRSESKRPETDAKTSSLTSVSTNSVPAVTSKYSTVNHGIPLRPPTRSSRKFSKPSIRTKKRVENTVEDTAPPTDNQTQSTTAQPALKVEAKTRPNYLTRFRKSSSFKPSVTVPVTTSTTVRPTSKFSRSFRPNLTEPKSETQRTVKSSTYQRLPPRIGYYSRLKSSTSKSTTAEATTPTSPQTRNNSKEENIVTEKPMDTPTFTRGKFHSIYRVSTESIKLATTASPNTVSELPVKKNLRSSKIVRGDTAFNKVNIDIEETVPRKVVKDVNTFKNTLSDDIDSDVTSIPSNSIKPNRRFSSRYREPLARPIYQATVPPIASSTAWLKFFVTDMPMTDALAEPEWFDMGVNEPLHNAISSHLTHDITDTTIKAEIGEENEIGPDVKSITFTQAQRPLVSADLKLSESMQMASKMNVETSNNSPSVTVSIFDALAEILTSTPKPISTTESTLIIPKNIDNGVSTINSLLTNGNPTTVTTREQSTEQNDLTTKIVQSSTDVNINNPPTTTTPQPAPTTTPSTTTTPASTLTATDAPPTPRRPFATILLYSTTDAPITDKLTTSTTPSSDLTTTESSSMVFNTISDLILSSNHISSELTSMLSSNIMNLLMDMDEETRSKIAVNMTQVLKSLSTTVSPATERIDASRDNVLSISQVDSMILNNDPGTSMLQDLIDSTSTQAPFQSDDIVESTETLANTATESVLSGEQNQTTVLDVSVVPSTERSLSDKSTPTTNIVIDSDSFSTLQSLDAALTTHTTLSNSLEAAATVESSSPTVTTTNLPFTVGEVSTLINILSRSNFELPADSSAETTTASASMLVNDASSVTTPLASNSEVVETLSTTTVQPASMIVNSEQVTVSNVDAPASISARSQIDNSILNDDDFSGNVDSGNASSESGTASTTPFNVLVPQTPSPIDDPNSIYFNLSSPCVISPAQLWSLSRQARLLKLIENMIHENNLQSITTSAPPGPSPNSFNIRFGNPLPNLSELQSIANVELANNLYDDIKTMLDAQIATASKMTDSIDIDTKANFDSLITTVNDKLTTLTELVSTMAPFPMTTDIPTTTEGVVSPTTAQVPIDILTTLAPVTDAPTTTLMSQEQTMQVPEETTQVSTTQVPTTQVPTTQVPLTDSTTMTSITEEQPTTQASEETTQAFDFTIGSRFAALPADSAIESGADSTTMPNNLQTTVADITTANSAITTETITTTDTQPTTGAEITEAAPETTTVVDSMSTSPQYMWNPPYVTAWRSPPSPTPPPKKDYYIFGILPNNTVVRKNPNDDALESLTEASPYIIYGILPNNTLVRRFPNGTTVPKVTQKIDVLPIDPRSLRNPYHPIYRNPDIIKPITNPSREIFTNDITLTDSNESIIKTDSSRADARLEGSNVNNTEQMISTFLSQNANIGSRSNFNTQVETNVQSGTSNNIISLLTTTDLPSLNEILMNSIATAIKEDQKVATTPTTTREPRILTLDIDPETKQIRTERPVDGSPVFKFIPIDDVPLSQNQSHVQKLSRPGSITTTENTPTTIILPVSTTVPTTTTVPPTTTVPTTTPETTTTMTTTEPTTTSTPTTTTEASTTTTTTTTTPTTTTPTTTTPTTTTPTTTTPTTTTPTTTTTTTTESTTTTTQSTTTTTESTTSTTESTTTTTTPAPTTTTAAKTRSQRIESTTEQVVDSTTFNFQRRQPTTTNANIESTTPTIVYNFADFLPMLTTGPPRISTTELPRTPTQGRGVFPVWNGFASTTTELSTSTFSVEEDIEFLNNLKKVVSSGSEDAETSLANRIIALAVERSLAELDDTKGQRTSKQLSDNFVVTDRVPPPTTTVTPTTTTTTTAPTTTSPPRTTTISSSLEDDIRQFQNDAKLLQTLLSVTGQSPANFNIPNIPTLTSPQPTQRIKSANIPSTIDEELKLLSSLLASPSPLNTDERNRELLRQQITQRTLEDSKVDSQQQVLSVKPLSVSPNTPIATTTQPTTSSPTTSTPSLEDDLKNFQEDTKLLQTLLQLQTGQSTVTQRSKVTATGLTGDETLASLLGQPSDAPDVTKAPVTLSTEFGKSNDALLAALLKDQGIGPSSQNSIDEQIKLAALLNQVIVTPKAKARRTTTPPPPPPPPRQARPLLDGLSWLWQQWRQTAPGQPAPGQRPTRPPLPTQPPRTNWFGSGPFTGNADEVQQESVSNRVPLPPPRVVASEEGETAANRGQLVSAAINVTRAFSQFLGAAIQGAAQTVQNVIKAGQRAAGDFYTGGSG